MGVIDELPRRGIQHPGPVAAGRIDALPVALQRHALLLQPGTSLLQALVQALPAGTRSAVLSLHGGTLAPLAYVMPALSRSAEHAVYFSERFEAAAPAQLIDASVTYGQRDGRPWLHCHARWTDADGRRHCGHLLPGDVQLASPLAATAWCLDGAEFSVVADDETRFTLFKPVATALTTAGAGPVQALAVRVAPNQDICRALESLCLQHGLSHARVRGGVGSTVGAQFDDGRRVEPFVTELLIRDGRVRPGADGRPQAELEVSLVDHTGGLADGRLARGANAVLVTFELVLEAGD